MKRINGFLIGIMVFGLVILWGSLANVYAQEPLEDDGEVPIVVAPAGQLRLTFKELGLGNDDLDRTRTVRSYRVDLPGNLQILTGDNYFDLVTSHSLETLDKPASVQVDINGRPVSTLVLTGTNVLSNITRIELPAGVLLTGRNNIDITLDTGATCDEPGALVDLLIEETSALDFGYQQNPYPTDLGLYPDPFGERSILNIPTTIVLPDLPSSNDLSAAATIAAGLGRMSNGRIDLRAKSASELDPATLSDSHLIVIGKPDSNSLLSNLELPLPINDDTLTPGQGILEEIVSPWNEFRIVLIVSGLDEEGLLKASHTLNRQAHFLGMRGPIAIVIDLLPLPTSDTSLDPSFTLASLGYQDEIVYGVEPQAFDFWFELPPGWRAEDSPFFNLKFAHADILDPYLSVIDVKLNKVPIGSGLLDDSNVNGGELKVTLPIDLLETGLNRLQVEVEMNLLNGDKCRDAENERAWTVISSASEIFLPYSAASARPSLRYFPHPFSQAVSFDQTLFVLPDQPLPSLINDAIQLAAYMGRSSQPENSSPRMIYAAEADQNMREEYHLILLGLPTENTLLAEVNAYLPQSFVPDTSLLQPLVIDDVAFAPDPNRDAGLLQLTASPWNEGNSLLAITGTTEEGFMLSFRSLLESPGRLNGNLAVVERSVDVSSDEINPLNIYTTRTQSPLPTSAEESATRSESYSEGSLLFLAKRWWK
jgi:hypothetical protein